MKQAIILRTDLNMGKGKLCAQASHAAIETFILTTQKQPEWAELWLKEGQKKIVLRVSSEQALKDLFLEAKREVPAKLIVDAGHTQVTPGTTTALGLGPAPEPVLDKYISRYKLL
ncbi:peptidyl-tRNA hydrolase Pth2 [archaeon]|nr:peptidyl-tRNA hydrolase Pth2 [archaeon]